MEEALEAGIEEVIIMVRKDDVEDFLALINTQVSIENYDKLSRPFQEYAGCILEVGRRVSFARQLTQEGFGHAVLSVREAAGNEPFLLMLGDHLCRANHSTSGARQQAREVASRQGYGLCLTGLIASDLLRSNR